jgi:hypothetical protein
MEETRMRDTKMTPYAAPMARGYGCHVIDLRAALRDLPSGPPRMAGIVYRDRDSLDARHA